MFKEKKKLLSVTLALALLLPVTVFAANALDTSGEERKDDSKKWTAFAGGRRHFIKWARLENKEQWQGKIPEIPAEMMEKMQEMKEKKENGELVAKRGMKRGWMRGPRKLPEEFKEKMQEIHKKVTAGELTPKQAREAMKPFLEEFRQEKLQQRKAAKENQAEPTGN